MADESEDRGIDTPLVVYVDDEHTNRVVFERAFEKDFRIRTASSASDALAILETEHVGVLVTDQRMPGMSGNQLLEAAKQRYPNVVRICITAYSDLDPILRAVNQGLVARYLVKPWQRDELREMLRWACNAHELALRESAVHTRLLQNERLAMLGTLSAAALHDVTQPVAAIAADTSTLLEYARTLEVLQPLVTKFGDEFTQQQKQELAELFEEMPQLARDLHQAAQHAAHVLDRLPRLLGGSGRDTSTTADVGEVVEHAISLCRGQASNHRTKIELVGRSARLPLVEIAHGDLLQALLSVLVNAIQAVSRVREGRRAVEVSAAQIEERVVVSVTDNGPGMSEETLKKATKEFFTTREEGTGLGLSQCRRIIEQSGGELDLDSQEGKGTSVRIVLPVIDGSTK